MDSDELKSLQAPLKARYREAPKDAVITLKAEGSIGEGVTCSVATAKAMVEAGLHPATGGTRLSCLLRRHAAPGPRRLRRRHPQCRGHRP